MATFVAKVNPRYVINGIQFRDGLLTTDNPKVIATLRKSPAFGVSFVELGAEDSQRVKETADKSVEDVVEKAKETVAKSAKTTKSATATKTRRTRSTTKTK